jgi:hypothetical protein
MTIAILGVGVAVVSGGFDYNLRGQAIIGAPYLLFALLAGAAPKTGVLLSAICLFLHVELLQHAAQLAGEPGANFARRGKFLFFGGISPGLLALVAVAMILQRWIGRLRGKAEPDRC